MALRASGASASVGGQMLVRPGTWRQALRRFYEAVFSGGSDHRVAARATELQRVVDHVPAQHRPRVETIGSSLALEANGTTAGAGAALALLSAVRRRAPEPRLHAALRGQRLDPTSVNAACVAAVLALHNSQGEWSAAVECFNRSMFTTPRALSRHPAIAASAVHALAATGDWVAALHVLDAASATPTPHGAVPETNRLLRRRDTHAAWLSDVLSELPAEWDVAVRMHTFSAAAVGLPEQTRSALGQQLAARLSRGGAGDDAVQRILSQTPTGSGNDRRMPSVERWAGLVGSESLANMVPHQRRRVVDSLEARGDWMSACRLLDATQPVVGSSDEGTVTLTVGLCSRLVVTLVKAGKTQLAKRALRRMMDAGVQGESLAAALRAMLVSSTTYAAASAWRQVLASHNVPLDAACHERLLVLSARANNWQDAMALLLSRDAPATPSSVAHDEVQFAFGRARVHWATCVAVYQRMADSGVRPSEVAFKSTVSSCLDQGADDAAQAVLVATIRLGVGR